MRLFIFLLLLTTTSTAFTLETPKGGRFDSRVKFINYNPAEVVKLVGHYGYSTHIKFSSDEIVDKIAMGDSKAWSVAPVRNHIFIKPIGDDPNTNMIVVTNLRTYNFVLSVSASKKLKNMFFQINFKYPKQQKKVDQKKLKQQKIKNSLNKKKYIKNWNYWMRGKGSIAPSSVYDDGRFTYLTFPANIEMPAVYYVGAGCKESLVNTSINSLRPNTIIVHRVSKKLVLKNGVNKAVIFNKSFKINNIYERTGTTSEKVKRVIKGN